MLILRLNYLLLISACDLIQYFYKTDINELINSQIEIKINNYLISKLLIYFNLFKDFLDVKMIFKFSKIKNNRLLNRVQMVYSKIILILYS